MDFYSSGFDEFDQLNEIFEFNFPIDDEDIVLNDFLVLAFGVIPDISWFVDDIGFLKEVFLGVVAVLVVVVVVYLFISFGTLGLEDVSYVKVLCSMFSLLLGGLTSRRGSFGLNRALFNLLFLQMGNILFFYAHSYFLVISQFFLL